MSIIDENFFSPNNIQETCVEIGVEIGVRLSSLVLSYLPDNAAGHHSEFDSSETLRDDLNKFF